MRNIFTNSIKYLHIVPASHTVDPCFLYLFGGIMGHVSREGNLERGADPRVDNYASVSTSDSSFFADIHSIIAGSANGSLSDEQRQKIKAKIDQDLGREGLLNVNTAAKSLPARMFVTDMRTLEKQRSRNKCAIL